MRFSPDRAEIRFGCGLSPHLPRAADPDALLVGLDGPDAMVARFPMPPYDRFSERLVEGRRLRRALRERSGGKAGRGEAKQIRAQLDALGSAAYEDRLAALGQALLRWGHSEQGFRERLAQFWSDHFTAVGKSRLYRSAVPAYVDMAIRPNLSGRFSDMLIAVVTHPVMLQYLDQQVSVGPGSAFAARRNGARGLNENLAREVIELHTLGVDGPYTQADVRQLAELFTGMGITAEGAFRFSPGQAEPGPETVLGRSYGGDPARLEPVLQALRDLAAHPATAGHIARKLAVHFVSDAPDPGLVDHVAARFRETGGELRAVYAALLEHPAAWDAAAGNVKPPFDFIASAFRALAIPPAALQQAKAGQVNRLIQQPMRLMGQFWQRPDGPDGWPEEDMAWVTPQGLSARVRWAMAVPRRLLPALPDPRVFVEDALGAAAPEPVRFAARAAETRAEAVGLILSAPAFQRR